MSLERSASHPLLLAVPTAAPALDLQPLFDFTQAHLGDTVSVPEQLCQVVTDLTAGQGMLELMMVTLPVALPRQHVSLQVSYAGYTYGSLHLLPDPHHPHRSVLPLADGRLLASCVAQQCYLLEQSALLHYLLPAPPIIDIDPLTTSEFFLLEQLMRGATGASLAHDLDRSIRTIEKHCENIYTKLGVTCQLHALLAAFYLHLVSLLMPPTAPVAPIKQRSARKRRR